MKIIYDSEEIVYINGRIEDNGEYFGHFTIPLYLPHSKIKRITNNSIKRAFRMNSVNPKINKVTFLPFDERQQFRPDLELYDIIEKCVYSDHRIMGRRIRIY